MATRPIIQFILLSCMLVGHGVIVAAEQLPNDIAGLIELLAISSQPAGNEPIYTPNKDTPRDDPRVLAFAAAAQLKGKGNSAFPQLLRYFDDKRQSVAFRRVIPHDVGDTCFCIIREQIFPVPRDYTGSFYRVGADGKLHARPLFFEPALFNKATLPSWLEKRKDKSLREMQIEALTWLINQELQIGFPNKEDKAVYLYPLERRLDEIKTNKPLTDPEKKAPQNPFE